MSRHAEAWLKIRNASQRVSLNSGEKYSLVKEWAKAFLEEVGDWGIAVFGKGVVTVRQLVEEPEKYPDFVEFIFKIARGGE